MTSQVMSPGVRSQFRDVVEVSNDNWSRQQTEEVRSWCQSRQDEPGWRGVVEQVRWDVECREQWRSQVSRPRQVQ
jgi:hypothetical protein